jgi:hypothetical protein
MNDPAVIVLEVGWTPGPVRTGAERLVPIGIRSQDRPARSHSLYQLRYPSYFMLRYRKLSPLFTYVNISVLDAENH